MFTDLEFIKTCLNGLLNWIEKVENRLLKQIEKVENRLLKRIEKVENLAVSDAKCYLTFSSPNSFTLAVATPFKHWDGTLEYFASDNTWTTWNGASVLSAVTYNGEYVLCLRGTGNTRIASDIDGHWVLTGSNIACIGNIENLLDYTTVKSGAHPTMANNCYFCMFYGCTSLTQTPALPATTLADDCYNSMFRSCTSLIQAPVLPATTLAYGCYNNMFSNCTSLTQAPALPATTLANNCYANMFDGCTSLKLSSIKTDEYIQEYRIPSSGNGITATSDLANMFNSTGGTFTGTPEINKSYYLSSDNMIVRETEIATLNGYVGSMINNAIPKSDALIVTITDNNGTLSADMTFSEILNAINAGISVLVYYNGDYFPFMGLLANDLRFGSSWCADADDVDNAAVLTPMIEITENGKVNNLSAQIFIPKELPNPNALTFTGAVTGSYDGSAAKTVNIPSAVTDDHINELINAALNAIGVAEEGAY